ncbi:lens fiber membrane intrinsic protein-like [Hydractinia symbiolongicarpus]|uniref:lens fiber membrane intrinsic protein-like n=1 Tax=Hydractinia symbiolongicarpus TaxID=13093 RepID=UPI0025502209|nr:lens fiber membrane intrinsic protein-like [Hydractinia symbiolongicarpus]
MVAIRSISLAIAVVTCTLFWASTIGVAWVKNKMYPDSSIGIWRICVPIHGCSSISYDDSTDVWHNAVRAFVCLAIIANFVGIGLLAAGFWSPKIRGIIATFPMFLASLFEIIALSVYAGKFELPEAHQFGWSFILGWVASVCAIASAILAIFSEKY